jgi:hypothetical protein
MASTVWGELKMKYLNVYIFSSSTTEEPKYGDELLPVKNSDL